VADIELENLRILFYPHPALRERAEEVTDIDGKLISIAKRMEALMYEAEGVGLAAPQVGIGRRFVVVRMPLGSEEGFAPPELYINPVILEREGAIEDVEGCLSIPGLRGKVRRSARVLVAAYDKEGNEVRIEAEGLGARLWEHEVDHLNGELFIDKLNPASRIALKRKLAELERQFKRGK